ncbi:Cerato-platanin [Pisolithus sp. B1]|nr:Cerato-platanin [Pisolithus sp. B1]
MKFLFSLFSLLALALLAFSQTTTETLSYDTTYDDASEPLSNLACSDGVYGLETKGYNTLGDLPTFPNVGGVYTVTEWDSPACGTCYNVTYGSTSIFILAVDVSQEGFNIAETAMNTLTGNLATELGRVNVQSTQVNASYCGISA